MSEIPKHLGQAGLAQARNWARIVFEKPVGYNLESAVPHQSFPPEASLGWQPSRLVMSIQPEEGIVLGFQAKYPGPTRRDRPHQAPSPESP